jgi:heme oxygenase (biliverdin-IX-beta and delta-forming)
MNLEVLKTSTRPEHEATESVMPLMQAGLTVEQYTTVLQRLSAVVISWEQWAVAHTPPDLAEMVRERCRGPLIERDLRLLGSVPGEPAFEFPSDEIPGLQGGDPNFRASFLGAMYVMEGSRLGGQYIARHLEETLGFQPGEGDAYFRGYGEQTGTMWRAFKRVLGEVPDEREQDVIAAAKAMFAYFREGMLSPVVAG